MRHAPFRTAIALAALAPAAHVLAGPSGPIIGASGTANVSVEHDIEGGDSDSGSILFPGDDAIGVTGAEGLSADVTWSLAQSAGQATLNFTSANMSAPIGRSDSDLSFTFTTDSETYYTLSGTLGGLFAEVIFNGDRSFLETDPLDGPMGNVGPDGGFEESGFLPAGEHTLMLTSFAQPVQMQSTLSSADVTLTLIPAPGSGIALAAGAFIAARRRRR